MYYEVMASQHIRCITGKNSSVAQRTNVTSQSDNSAINEMHRKPQTIPHFTMLKDVLGLRDN